MQEELNSFELLYLDGITFIWKTKLLVRQVLRWKLIPWKINAIKHKQRWKNMESSAFPIKKIEIKHTLRIDYDDMESSYS